MLIELHIENIAVIERADIGFSPGLNVLSGETGAGKSIVIDALSAVTGGRVSRELVRAGAERAAVSAVFDPDRALEWCAENDVDCADGELILMRRVGTDGRSSCRVNGAPVSVAQLRELGELLLDIHGQNDGQKLLDESRHRQYLDAFGGHGELLSAYKSDYDKYNSILTEIARLKKDEGEKERLTDSLRREIEELDAANLRAGERDELSARSRLMMNAEKLTDLLDGAYEALYGADDSAAGAAGAAEEYLRRASALESSLTEAARQTRESRILLEDAAETVRAVRESLDFSREEFDRVEGRLALISRLERKYSADEAGLIERLDRARARLDELDYSGDRLIKLTAALERQEAACRRSAGALTAARERAGEALARGIEAELRDLSMPSAKFLVSVEPRGRAPGVDAPGADEVLFLMTANAGEEPGRISRIASGGELSRIMLAMKNVFSRSDPTPTVIFDEIDSGVSGVAARRVAEKLGSLSRGRQVLCVTHLPQIAAMADAQYQVAKEERAGRTYTAVRPLNREGRRQELSRLMSGDVITPTSLQSAEEQLASADTYKNKLGNI